MPLRRRANTVRLYHVSTVFAVGGIMGEGIIANYRRKYATSVWLCTPCMVANVARHVVARDGYNQEFIVYFACRVKRSSLVRRRRGIWRHAGDVPKTRVEWWDYVFPPDWQQSYKTNGWNPFRSYQYDTEGG